MNYLDAFRDGEKARALVAKIKHAAKQREHYRLMEFCGGHTHTIFRYGLMDILPGNVQMMHGPGCPVCVLPIKRVDQAIKLAKMPDTILCSYGDIMRVPGTGKQSLQHAKSQGCDIRIVYSPLEVLKLAQTKPDKTVIFFAVGFETTTPPTAAVLDAAINQKLNNFFIHCNHVITPPAVDGIMHLTEQQGAKHLDGLIGPGHVSVITGTDLYQDIARKYQLPITIAGFEPLDLLISILMLIKQINTNTHVVENQYTRAVTDQGNQKARTLIERYFELRDSFEWRGLGEMPKSALKIKAEYAARDAEAVFDVSTPNSAEYKACECPAVLTGRISPPECKLFGKPCTPENPLGSCMVSSEGACAAYYQYRGSERIDTQTIEAH